jgi:5-methylcytosine-specific restriction endonuclease McrA
MPQDPFYSSKKWREVRAAYLRKNPWCQTCLQIGIRGRAVEVDHRRSIRSGGDPFHEANLCGLCKTHHSQKTIYVDGQHKGSGKSGLVVTGPDGFPVNPGVIHHGPTRYPKK